jgi:hypothetical protein
MISFLTPYWSGPEMMKIHLHSIRQFHPSAPILVSKRGGDREEMEAHRAEFGIHYWLEDCSYDDAFLRLFERCETEYVCVLDHDTVLLSSLDTLLNGLEEGRYDLVGIEDRIKLPGDGEWMRYAPGYMDATFLLFNWGEFKHRWGLGGIRYNRPPWTVHDEYHYGICQKLKRHKYLLPFHTNKYGLANLLKDGDIPVLWHLWYGAYRERLIDGTAVASGLSRWITVVERSEVAFLEDYPCLDLSQMTPAWGPWISLERGLARLKRWRSYGFRKALALALSRIHRRLRRLL